MPDPTFWKRKVYGYTAPHMVNLTTSGKWEWSSYSATLSQWEGAQMGPRTVSNPCWGFTHLLFLRPLTSLFQMFRLFTQALAAYLKVENRYRLSKHQVLKRIFESIKGKTTRRGRKIHKKAFKLILLIKRQGYNKNGHRIKGYEIGKHEE
jgi:hypothetical protein